MSDRECVVSVKDVVKDFRPGLGLRKKRVLHGVSFDVHQGEIFGFVGPNGAGKTTTLKVLMGLITATSGQATILGHDVSESTYRNHIGFLPENPYFYTYLTAREILDFYAKLSGVVAADRAARVDLLLDWVGLQHAADARLRTYSKGMLQRVGIAQALVHDPEVVFLDEPMSGLDPIGRKEIRDIILRLRDDGKTVFMNTHILSDVETICDRVAIIVKGAIRYEGLIEHFIPEDGMRTDVVLKHITAETANAIEEGLECELQGLGEQIEVRIHDKLVEGLLRKVLDYGGEVVSVTPARMTLEHIFLDTVQQAGEGDDEGEGRGAADGDGASADPDGPTAPAER
jgi:ABC-2 type transport system ATP-binding protein